MGRKSAGNQTISLKQIHEPVKVTKTFKSLGFVFSRLPVTAKLAYRGTLASINPTGVNGLV